jgi:hypothetical protein
MADFLADEDDDGNDGGMINIAVVSSVPEFPSRKKKRRSTSGKRLMSSAEKTQRDTKRAKRLEAMRKPAFTENDDSDDETPALRPASPELLPVQDNDANSGSDDNDVTETATPLHKRSKARYTTCDVVPSSNTYHTLSGRYWTATMMRLQVTVRFDSGSVACPVSRHDRSALLSFSWHA